MKVRRILLGVCQVLGELLAATYCAVDSTVDGTNNK